jgi:DNA-binding transcriptional ArsR family regulator
MASQAIFTALVEPRRRDILHLVRDRPRSAGEIGSHFDITQQAVSQHLQVLTRAGLVDVRREGQRRIYAINPRGLEAVDQFLAELWPAGLERLKRAVESRGDG